MVPAAPHRLLRSAVRRYAGYLEQSATPHVRREVPNAGVTLIISFGDSISLLALESTGSADELIAVEFLRPSVRQRRQFASALAMISELFSATMIERDSRQ